MRLLSGYRWNSEIVRIVLNASRDLNHQYLGQAFVQLRFPEDWEVKIKKESYRDRCYPGLVDCFGGIHHRLNKGNTFQAVISCRNMLSDSLR